LGIGEGFKENLTAEPLHFLECRLQLASVANRLLQPKVLLPIEGDTDGFQRAFPFGCLIQRGLGDFATELRLATLFFIDAIEKRA
jgi:hypothetical protein